jgi:hypothetical protein
MSSNPATIQRPLTRDETGTLFGQTMGLVALLFAFGFLVGAGVAPSVPYYARSDPPPGPHHPLRRTVRRLTVS